MLYQDELEYGVRKLRIIKDAMTRIGVLASKYNTRVWPVFNKNSVQ